MRRSSAALVVIGMTFVLSVGFAVTAPRAVADTPLPITIGYQATSADDWLLFTARDLKLFEKVGLAPTYVKFAAGPPMIAAAESKSIDVTAVGSVSFMRGLVQGVDWVIIGIYSEGAYVQGMMARKDSGIDSMADLKGKRVGYLKGTTAHFGMMLALRQFGVSLDQVTLLDMPPAEQVAAMAKKDIDAAMVWEPWMQEMRRDANAKIIATEGDLGIYTNVSVISARRDWLRDNRETAVRFLQAFLMAYEVLQQDPSIGIIALAKEMGIRKAWAEMIYKDNPPPNMYMWADPRYRYSLVKGAAFQRRMGYLATFLFNQQIFPAEVDVSDVLDASIITEVLSKHKQGQ